MPNSAAAIQDSQKQFLLAAPIGVIVTDADDAAVVRLANPAVGAVLSLLPDALLDQHISVVAASGGIEEYLVQALVTGKPVRGEVALGDPGSAQRHISVFITHGTYGSTPALFWWLNDLTEVRRTEAEWRRRERQLQAVIDAAQDAVIEIQLQTGTANVSPRFWQMLGYDLEAALGMQATSAETIYHYVREDFQLAFATLLAVPMQDQAFEWTGPLRPIKGEGEVWLYIRGRVTDTETEPRIIGVATNITAQKAVEESLRVAAVSAEEANRAKSAFLATMSHEIRTPMTAVLGSLEYLLDTPLVKEQHRMAAIAKESAVSLLSILNDILDLSKIEAGKLTLEAIPVSPRSAILGAVDAAQIMARKKGLYLRHKFTGATPALIITDPTRLRQLLMNLINNAVKFTESGGVSVTSEIVDEGGGKGQLRVAIQDTGIGMNEEQRSRLFRAFSQADDSTTRKFGGTGLGLSICQRLVEHMGGTVEVASEPGRGSTFSFTVQVGMTDAQLDESQTIKLKGLDVLVVDPDPESAEKTAEELVEVGAKVRMVMDAKAALLALAGAPPSLVLLEQDLTDARGLDLVPAMRALAPDLGVILYTAEEPETIGWAAQEAGVFYLPRSTPYDQFLKTIQSFAVGAPLLENKKAGRLNGRVLIAEDTASVRQILEMQVRGLGVEVDFVENGLQALEKIQRGRYALVVSDLHMPEMDGYGLVHEWRDREAKRGRGERLPIVALTADVLIGDKSKFIEEGFDDYMAKPVTRDALRGLITRWLTRDNQEGALDLAEEASSTAVAAGSPVSRISTDPDAPVNHARLIEVLGMDEADILAEAMGLFLETARETMAALEAAYAKGDTGAAKGPAHSLKGSARMAGAILLGDIAAELDAAAKKGELLPERLLECRKELERVIAYVNHAYLGQ